VSADIVERTPLDPAAEMLPAAEGGVALDATPEGGADRPALRRCVSISPTRFAAEIWAERAWLSGADELPAGFGDLFSRAAADEVLSRQGLRTPFLRVAKDGITLPTTHFTTGGGVGAGIADQASDVRLTQLFAEGATIVLQALHRTHPPVIDFAQALGVDLGHPVQVNAYLTPPQSQGFSTHYDVHDVFVLQVSGEKHWLVHAPVREHPRPDEPWSERRAAVEARARDKPVIDVVMRPGDALYLPSGWLHSAVARAGTSIHLTIGMQALTGADVVRELVAELSRNPALRAPLPVNGSDADPGVLDAAVREMTAAFMRALQAHAADGPARTASAVRRSFERMTRPEPVAPLATVEAASDLSPKAVVRLREGLTARVTVDADGVHLAAAGQGLRLPAATEAAVRALAGGESLWAGALPDLDEADSLVVARRLLRCGMLVTEPRD
jgi:ribosomal protein L16 Arg81 hydroxylase